MKAKTEFGSGAVRGRSTIWGKLLAVVFVLCALGVGWGGFILAQLGGSPFFLVEAALLLAAGVLLWLGSRWALWVHGILVLLTIGWSLAEAGFDGWAMLPRISLVYVLALLLLIPAFRRGLAGGPPFRRAAFLLTAIVFVAAPAAAVALGSKSYFDVSASRDVLETDQGAGADWADWGGTPGGPRYSRLDQITPANVGSLEVAWQYNFGTKHGMQVTPLKIGDAVYVCDSDNVVVSLDPDTGKERWRFEAKPVEWAPWAACRGLGYHRIADASPEDVTRPANASAVAPAACIERLILATSDARIMAIDARTGKLCADFAEGGAIDALRGLGPVEKGYYWFNNAPNVFAGKIVVSGSMVDNQYWLQPSGVIRAYDAVTGELAWAYDVGAPDRIGAPPEGETYTPGTPNAWAQMSYDPELNLLYAATGNATPDYFGAQRRPIDEEITSAVIALDMDTGRRKWLFRTVNHDVWDYDIGSQPVLFDMPDEDGGIMRALAMPTKRAETFILDRETGEPIVPVEQRPAPQRGAAPEERLAPTQPFSAFPSLAGDPLTEAKMWGITPFDNLYCRIKFREARYDGPMTPPGPTPSITYPGFLGGMDWPGVSIDPERGIMLAATAYLPNYTRLVARKDAGDVEPMGKAQEGLAALVGLNPQLGTPYAVGTGPFLSPLMMPCTQPPWGRISAVDMRANKVLWSRPLGTGKENGPMGIRSGLPIPIGAPAFGGTLSTRGGVTFTAAAVDNTVYAFDTATGKKLWEAGLPYSGNANPMSYRSDASGRQFVLVPAGGHHATGLGMGDALIAYALPKE